MNNYREQAKRLSDEQLAKDVDKYESRMYKIAEMEEHVGQENAYEEAQDNFIQLSLEQSQRHVDNIRLRMQKEKM